MKSIQTILVIMALNVHNLEGGSLKPEFLRSFSNETESKDTIIEFPSIIEKVLGHPDLSTLQGDERRSRIVSLLQEQSQAIQLPILNAIRSLSLTDRATPFWVANKIALREVSLGTLKALSAVPGEFTVRAAKTGSVFPVEVGPVFQTELETRDKRESDYQWGVEKIGAPTAFANGITGDGIVVGIIDTGARVTHVALQSNYKGDEYSWKDAINNKPSPYDDNGHGTHVTGTAVGTENGIGVAPGAKWISCKAMDAEGRGTEEGLTTCGQFMACPNNSSASCTGYPDIVSNSWGGGVDDDFYNSVIQSWVALDIVPIFALGNSGPICGSANSPGDQPNLISVGSTDKKDKVSSFSSRGPGGNIFQRLFGIGTTKPEVAAPGGKIVSASHSSDTGYSTLSGTSMAAPHVAGAAALILSTDKTLGPKGVRDRLEQSAVGHKPQNSCATFFSAKQPNNEYGYGRIDMPSALNITA